MVLTKITRDDAAKAKVLFKRARGSKKRKEAKDWFDVINHAATSTHSLYVDAILASPELTERLNAMREQVDVRAPRPRVRLDGFF